MATQRGNMSTSDGTRTDHRDQETGHALKGAAFLSAVASMGIIAGFGSTLALARKKSPDWFSKGVVVPSSASESGASLALRALGWGSLFSCCGVGLLSFTVWKLLDVHSLSEFRLKMASIFPSIPRNAESALQSVDWEQMFESKGAESSSKGSVSSSKD